MNPKNDAEVIAKIQQRRLEPPDDEHLEGCPQHEDADEVFECGGVGEHFCSLVDRKINGCYLAEGECCCHELAERQRTIAADVRYDREQGR